MDFNGITDNFHNLLPNVRGHSRTNLHLVKFSLSQIYQDYSWIFEDLRGQQKVRESVADSHGLSRTVLVRESPRSDFRGNEFSQLIVLKFTKDSISVKTS